MPRPPGAVINPTVSGGGWNSGSASSPSLSMRAGRTTVSIPQACNVRAVPLPTLTHCACAGRCSGARRCAAFTAAGLVNTAIGASSAFRNAARACAVSLICKRHGESARTRPPCRATGRRSGAWSPLGRNEIRVQASADGAACVICRLCESGAMAGQWQSVAVPFVRHGCRCGTRPGIRQHMHTDTKAAFKRQGKIRNHLKNI